MHNISSLLRSGAIAVLNQPSPFSPSGRKILSYQPREKRVVEVKANFHIFHIMLQILPTPPPPPLPEVTRHFVFPPSSLPCVLIYMLPPPSNPLLFHGGMTSYGSPLSPPLAARAKHPTPPPLYSHVYGIQGTAPMANGIPRRERRLAGASGARWLARREKK